MAGFGVLNAIKVLGFGLVLKGFTYPYRRAMDTIQATQPDLKGLALWQAVYQHANTHNPPEFPPVESFQFPGAITEFIADGATVTLQTQTGAIRLLALADDLIQIRVSADGSFAVPFSYAIEKPEPQWETVAFEVIEEDNQITLSTAALTIQIDRNPYRMTVTDKGGHILLEDEQGIGMRTESPHLRWRLKLPKDTACYGLGEKATELNLSGKRFELWNTDPAVYARGDDPIYMSIPFLTMLSENGSAGLFIDNPHRAWMDICAAEQDTIDYRVVDGEFRLYLMVGSPETLIERYTEITGRMSLPPLWALGYHQCRWSYYPQSRVMEIGENFRSRDIPCDTIHIDIHYMDGYRCFTWDTKRFPDRRGMIKSLHDQGFKVLTMIDPGIKVDPGYHVYDEGIKQDAFMKYPDGKLFTGPVWPEDCHFPDFSDPDVREWWGNLYQGLLDDGIDAFWNDMNEIAIISTNPSGETRYVPNEVIHHNEGNPTTHAEIHNQYGMLQVRASTEGLKHLRPDRRPMLLTRSGWAGVQRYAMHWTADNNSEWDDLLLGIQMMLNLGYSGVSMTGPDVGGFAGIPSGELFARWLQVGAFTPFFRVHSMAGTPDQEPWAYGEEFEAINRKTLELRYQLLPYIYTSVWQSVERGLPIARAMSYMYPNDPQTFSMDNQYFFGDSILVAPIVKEGAVSRKVYLPEGEWVDYWSREKHSAGWITVAVPLDTIPLFVKAGAVIPHWPVQQYVGELEIDELRLDVFTSSERYESTLYEDDGVRPDYNAEDAHRVSVFRVETGTLSRTIQSGSYADTISKFKVNLIGLEAFSDEIIIEGGDLKGRSDEAGVLVLEIESSDDFSIRFG